MATVHSSTNICFRCQRQVGERSPHAEDSEINIICRPDGCYHFQHFDCMERAVVDQIETTNGLASQMFASGDFHEIEIDCQDGCESKMHLYALAVNGIGEPGENDFVITESPNGSSGNPQFTTYQIEDGQLVQSLDSDSEDESDDEEVEFIDLGRFQMLGGMFPIMIDQDGGAEIVVEAHERLYHREMEYKIDKKYAKNHLTALALVISGLVLFLFSSLPVALGVSLALPTVLYGGAYLIDRYFTGNSIGFSSQVSIFQERTLNISELED